MSQRTSLMVFGSKPKHPNSLDPVHKRRISLINIDMKLVTGIDAARFHQTATHTLSPLQLVAGSDLRIHHGICRARDAIKAASRRREGCGMLDADFEAGFDYLAMSWTYEVLLKKNCSANVVSRLKRVYSDNLCTVVVNNVLGKTISNHRCSLKQGGIPSMYYSSIELDPILEYLVKRLQGIPVFRLPVARPAPQPAPRRGAAWGAQLASRLLLHSPMKGRKRRHTSYVQYADDLKCVISCMQDFHTSDNCLTTQFLLAANPQFQHIVYLEALYRTEVLGEWAATGGLGPPGSVGGVCLTHLTPCYTPCPPVPTPVTWLPPSWPACTRWCPACPTSLPSTWTWTLSPSRSCQW